MTAPSNKTIVYIEPAAAPTEHVAPSNEFNVWYVGHKTSVRITLEQGLEQFAADNGLVVIKDRVAIAINPQADFDVSPLAIDSKHRPKYAAEIAFRDNSRRVLFSLNASKLVEIIAVPEMGSARAGAQVRVSSATPVAHHSKA